MEPFLRKRLTFLSFFWDKIWPVAAPDDGVPGFPDPAASAEPEPPATEPCSPPVPMQLFQALYDFRARCSAELSVSRGDRLYALKEEGDYIFARRLSGPPSTGLVPITHLAKATPETLSDHPWYFSGISRAGAQQLLLSPANAPGAFLIRPSESSHGDYSLSVRVQARVRHYRISTAADGLYLQKGRLFPSLEELLAYYKANWKLIRNPLLQPCVPQKAASRGTECPPPPQKLPQQDEWERPRSEFALRRKLGEGYFGEVWEGLWLGSTPVAVKIIKSAYMKLADLSKEIQTLKSLKHERLIRLHAVCSEGQPVYIVTELMRKGNLQAFLGSPEGRALGLPLLLSFACQVAEGMSYLEDRRIVHRDLAARNVLVGDDLACKVADFGLARLLKDDIYSPSSGSKIPVKWTAPEAANYRIYSQKSDVWSFGVLLYEVFTYGQCPYEGLSNHETLQQVTRGYRLPCPASCPAEVYTLMLECWKGSPEERPAFATLQKKLSAAHRRLTPAHT
ncbi:tyrosine-protein kinase Srms isoform X4 [Zalophus californianus]|uniref:Tyrosine-protein kinase n=2 Tax=Zalophus californianus TaxID=9704 RepID=A0A6J2FEE4_ZALCA|nr:tyrosine-protein kinase Srms isoform X4 [Zalophus californianus]XP_027946956.1 tyrosine-protein kinase Srms [Eumetopias jubatus]